MPQNPPHYFPPNYFDGEYWGREQAEGAISATLGGASTFTASLSSNETKRRTGVSKKKKRHSNFFVEPIWIQQFKYEPVKIEKIEAQPAFMSANIAGAAVMNGAGFTFDKWARAREEDEFWLMVA